MKSAVFLYITLSLCAPMVPYLFVAGNFSFVDGLLFVFFILVLRQKNVVPVPAVLLALLSLLSIVLLLLNQYRSDINVSELFFVFRWLYYAMMVFFIVNLVVKEPGYGEVVLRGVAFSVLVSALVVWYFWWLSPRYSGVTPMLHLIHEGAPVMVNRNYFGFFLSIGVPLWFVLAMNYRGNGLLRFGLFAVALFLMVSSVLTFSKGTWLASFLPVMFLLYVRFTAHTSLYLKLRLLLMYGVVFSALLFAVLEYSVSDDGSLSGGLAGRVANSSETNSQRVQFVIDSFEIMMMNPVIGVGPGNYRAEAISSGLVPTGDPHNALLWIGAELGLAGFALVLFAVIHLGIVIYKSYNSHTLASRRVSELLFVAYLSLVLNIAVHGLPFSMKHFWVVYAVAYALYLVRYRPVAVALAVK